MSEAARHIVCPHCRGVNRVPTHRPAAGAKCGRCHEALFTGEPCAVEGSDLRRQIERNDIPVLVDFWAPWCGPCKMMAPVLEQAAARLEPDVRVLKVNTDRDQQAAMEFGIRGIPTLILFQQGHERARTSGAMDLAALTDWIRTQAPGSL